MNPFKLSIISLALFNLFAVIATTNVSAQIDSEDTPCPATLFIAILENDYEVARLLLKYNADPNASLENCHFNITDNQLKILIGDRYSKVFEVSWFYTPWLNRLKELLEDLPENSSLLHVAALHYLHIQTAMDSNTLMYNLLTEYGANDNAMDAIGRTPKNIADSKNRYTHLRPL